MHRIPEVVGWGSACRKFHILLGFCACILNPFFLFLIIFVFYLLSLLVERALSQISMICTWNSWIKLIWRLWTKRLSRQLMKIARFELCYCSLLDSSEDMYTIWNSTWCTLQVLLGSELIKSSSEERSLLKNLGSWLGKLTIGRNQVLRAREIDPKSLIIEVIS